MQPEIQAVIRLVRENRVWEAVAAHIEKMIRLENDDPAALRPLTESPTGVTLLKQAHTVCGLDASPF